MLGYTAETESPFPLTGRTVEKEARPLSLRKCDLGLDFEFRKLR